MESGAKVGGSNGRERDKSGVGCTLCGKVKRDGESIQLVAVLVFHGLCIRRTFCDCGLPIGHCSPAIFPCSRPNSACIDSVSLVYAAKGKYPRTLLLTLATAWVLVVSSFVYHRQIRTTVRWAMWSGQYKNTLARQSSLSGELKHMDWDGWGWAGMDTTVYLVFDPTDSLSMSASSYQPRKSSGLPCSVADVTRLERDWYAVTFYTDREWNTCR